MLYDPCFPLTCFPSISLHQSSLILIHTKIVGSLDPHLQISLFFPLKNSSLLSENTQALSFSVRLTITSFMFVGLSEQYLAKWCFKEIILTPTPHWYMILFWSAEALCCQLSFKDFHALSYLSLGRFTRRSATVIKVNSTYRSVKSDRVNLVAPAWPVHRAGQTLLTPAVCLPVQAVYRSVFEPESYKNNGRLTLMIRTPCVSTLMSP